MLEPVDIISIALHATKENMLNNLSTVMYLFLMSDIFTIVYGCW